MTETRDLLLVAWAPLANGGVLKERLEGRNLLKGMADVAPQTGQHVGVLFQDAPGRSDNRIKVCRSMRMCVTHWSSGHRQTSRPKTAQLAP